MATKKLKEKENTALVDGINLEEFSGSGMEDAGAGDLVLSRFSILQSNSPQVQKDESTFVEGAEPGKIFDSGLTKVYDSIKFLAFKYNKKWIEWAPRESSQGIVAVHDDASCCTGLSRGDGNTPTRANGNTIMETAHFFGLNLSGEEPQPGYIAMTRTQLKESRRILTIAHNQKLTKEDGTMFRAPLWWRLYEVGVKKQKNQHGTWYGWDFSMAETLKEWCESVGADFAETIATVTSFKETVGDRTRTQDLLEGPKPDATPDDQVPF